MNRIEMKGKTYGRLLIIESCGITTAGCEVK